MTLTVSGTGNFDRIDAPVLAVNQPVGLTLREEHVWVLPAR